jgi:hypothetical protein
LPTFLEKYIPLAFIDRLVDYFERTTNVFVSLKLSDQSVVQYVVKKLDSIHPPDLFHTRVRGSFGATPFSNWNDLVRIAHIAAFKKAGSFDELRQVTHAQIARGERSDSGYKFVDEIGVSIQGVDANHAWEHALRLAKYLRQPLEALVEWRHNPKAAHPGESGVLEFVP